MMNQQFLRYLLNYKNRNSNRGFTLLELLVTIVIMAVLSGIALPSVLNQTLKAKQAAAHNHIGSVNRAQQVYRLERATFANSITQLSIDLPMTTNEYTYSFGAANATVAEFRATPQDNSLSALTGCTRANIVIGTLATTDFSIVEQSAPGGGIPATPPSC
ncbi:type IV pilin protein [Acaryochloris sp. CCMEE 5410]|uniref:type IV pilin protein n=1 Tax=Acaryochloris sp. CCMEE 5410 TaxID=310037 RepID=UPI00058591A2|nr:type IV pilin-like G/H family protein [Acaryochloris sp. CCMEE 5410]KAI9132145.1 prepilin-type N-terminal cleavage/methylation domain-containing protein [Acaryochloris sp. CCMEE 5410]